MGMVLPWGFVGKINKQADKILEAQLNQLFDVMVPEAITVLTEIIILTKDVL